MARAGQQVANQLQDQHDFGNRSRWSYPPVAIKPLRQQANALLTPPAGKAKQNDGAEALYSRRMSGSSRRGVTMTMTRDPISPAATVDGSNAPVAVYLVAAIASLALSVWGAWAQFLPNPDGALYLRSAELMANGQWKAAIAIYGWPFYGMTIAAVVKVTGLEPFAAAQVVNAFFSAVTTLAFIALVGRLSNDRLVVICAAIVIVLQPSLTSFRPSIIRDNCYLACFVLTLYFVCRDLLVPRLWTKLAIGGAIFLAGLFRIEGFFLAALVLIYYVALRQSVWKNPWVIIIVIGVGLLSIPALTFWNSDTQAKLFSGQLDLSGPIANLNRFFDVIGQRLSTLRSGILFPFGGGNVWGAYVGLVLGVVTVNVVRGITIPVAILAALSYFPKRLMPRHVNQFVLWFCFAQLPVLFLYAFWSLVLDKRYAAAMALVLDIPVAFVLAEAVRQWRSSLIARVFLPIAAATLIATWGFAVPKPSKLGYLKEAGLWIRDNVPSTARVLTNDARIAYFSGRSYGPTMAHSFGEPPSDAALARFDYLVVQQNSDDKLLPAVDRLSGKQFVRSFPGKDGSAVVVYTQQTSGAEGEK